MQERIQSKRENTDCGEAGGRIAREETDYRSREETQMARKKRRGRGKMQGTRGDTDGEGKYRLRGAI